MLKSVSPKHRESHLRATLKESLLDEGALNYMQVPMGQGTSQERVMELTWSLIHQQHWSIQVRHCRVPECYVEIFDPRAEVRRRTADKMRSNWRAWMKLEQLRFKSKHHCLLLDDLVCNVPQRVLHILFERDQFNPDSVAGCKFLRGLI